MGRNRKSSRRRIPRKDRTTLRLDAALYRRVKSYASRRDVTITSVLERALEDLLKRHRS